MKDRENIFFEKAGISYTQASNLYLKSPYLFAELVAYAELARPENGFTETQIKKVKENLQLAAESESSPETHKLKR